jgi:hydrophobe/amphiphile efflux-3 (HAE3) family protein
MNTIRQRIELWFEGVARWIFFNRLKVIIAVGILIAMLAIQLPHLTMDMSTEGFLHPNDPELVTYNQFRDQFGRDEAIIVALKAEDIFDLDFLTMLRQLHMELTDEVPYIDDITSLINARSTRGDGNDLIVEDLMENWPQTSKDIDIIRQRALSNPMYRNLLLSEDGSFTTIVIRTHAFSEQGQSNDLMAGFEEEIEQETPEASYPPEYLSDAENSAVVEAVERIISRYRSDTVAIHLAGSPVVIHFLKRSLIKDMRTFMALAILAVAIVLYIMFRRLSGVLLPLLIVILSLLSTLGFMAIFNVPIKLPTQILPSFILAVGVGTSVHILAIFYHRMRKGDTKAKAIVYSMGHSGLAIVMTNVTTAGGLLSFVQADVAPVADLGIFAAIGVMLAFVYTVVLLPALLAVIPLSTKADNKSNASHHAMDHFLARISALAIGRPKTILVVSAVVVLLSIAGSMTIRFSHDPVAWYPEDNIVRKDTETIDQELRGSLTMEAVLTLDRENGWYDPELLQRLDQMGIGLEAQQHEGLFIGKAFSLTTIVKEINQALNENHPEAYAIPTDRDLIAQELLLFENSGSDDLEDFTDSQFSKVRLTIKFPYVDAVYYKPVAKEIEHAFKSAFPDADFQLTGMIALLARTINNTITSMMKSYFTALVVITVLMVLLIGRLRIGLLSMIPNLAPILFTLGIIGWWNLPMDLFTMMVASIAIGLAVDDTIHFMHNFRRYYEESGDPKQAVAETLHTTGRAMLVTSVVLSLGFFILTLATMQNILRFGLLTGITILAALISDYFLAPALMVLVNKQKAPSRSAEKPSPTGDRYETA